MDRINEYYRNALLDNLCEEYKGMWRSAHEDKLKLLRLSLCQQAIPHVVTYAYQGKGVTRDYLLENYNEYINGYKVYDADGVSGYSYGLFVDYCYDNSLLLDVDVASIMWTDGANVVIPQTKAVIMYVSNWSDIKIYCDGYNTVKIYLFDESKVTLEDIDEDTTVTILRYSKDAIVDNGRFCLSDKIKIFDKTLKL